MADPFKPPPGAQEWLAACIEACVDRNDPNGERYSEESHRAYGLIGTLQHHAALTTAQAGKLNHWLWPERYDEHGVATDQLPPKCPTCERPMARFTAGSIVGPWTCPGCASEEVRDG